MTALSPPLTDTSWVELEAMARQAAEIYGGTWDCPNLPSGMIFAQGPKGPFHVLDIRSWGYLTGKGHGALGLNPDEAITHQDNLAQYVGSLCPATILAIIEERNALKAEVTLLKSELKNG